jgi:protein TonB
METKKSNRADLEKKKMLFLQTGFIVSMAIALAAFEWRTPDTGIPDLPGGTIIRFEDDLQSVSTTHPVPPAPVAPRPSTIFNLVDNSSVTDDFAPPDFGNNLLEANPVYAQIERPVLTDEKPPVDDEIFIVSEKKPEFPGGEKALFEYLKKNTAYPQYARESGISGTVYVTFVIEKDGSVSNIKVMRGIGFGCDEEAVRVISLMPKWSPGLQRTKPVRVSFNMPIAFVLKDA